MPVDDRSKRLLEERRDSGRERVKEGRKLLELLLFYPLLSCMFSFLTRYKLQLYSLKVAKI